MAHQSNERVDYRLASHGLATRPSSARHRARGSSSFGMLVLLAALAGVGTWYYLTQTSPTTPPATPPVAVVTTPAPAPVPRKLAQCIDTTGKILWSDQDCPAGSTALALKPNTGTTYSSAESMRPTRDMPPVYVPPPSNYSAAGGPVVVGGSDDQSAPTTVVGRRVYIGGGDFERRRWAAAEMAEQGERPRAHAEAPRNIAPRSIQGF